MSGRILVFVLLLFVVVSMSVTKSDFVVDTKSGRIRGVRYSMPTGKVVDAFLGIPFAKAPSGSLRFRRPQPIDPWKETYNATRLPYSCYQIPDTTFGYDFWGTDMWNPLTWVSEDCLYLNIWVPRGLVGQSAVMVWIFGGGFYSGTTALSLYDGKILAAESGVIVASVGYRVGVFGFFHLDAASTPANVGLFDQLAGLDWIRDNVAAFGGDPDSITLFGESAGAASVGLHLLSPVSGGKFQRAILQSGTANMPWATVTETESRRRSLELAVEVLGCPESNSNDGGGMETVAECMREITPQVLAEYQYVTSKALQFPFLPAVDGTFLPDHPEVLIRSRNFKRCPVLMGSNLNEGSYFLIYELFDLLSLNSVKMTRDDYVTSVRRLFYYYPQFGHVTSRAAIEAIIFQYTDWLDPEDARRNVLGLDLALGDSQFVCPLNRFAQAYSSAGESVYTYHLTQRYQSNPWPVWMGVLHGDDVLFVFGEALKPGRNFSREDQELSRLMMKYWTNFAKTGSVSILCERYSNGSWVMRSWVMSHFE